jgi:Ni,Fe-hydrogenase III small subunit
MPTDRYTKAVLTVIAGALLYIGAMLSGQPASAQTMAPASQAFVDERQPQPVVIVGWGTVRSDGKVFVNTVRDVGGFSRTDATLPVAVQATRQQPLPVAVHGLKIGADWDPVRTKVDNQPLTRFPGPP